jgi:hypothetical protein
VLFFLSRFDPGILVDFWKFVCSQKHVIFNQVTGSFNSMTSPSMEKGLEPVASALFAAR